MNAIEYGFGNEILDMTEKCSGLLTPSPFSVLHLLRCLPLVGINEALLKTRQKLVTLWAAIFGGTFNYLISNFCPFSEMVAVKDGIGKHSVLHLSRIRYIKNISIGVLLHV